MKKNKIRNFIICLIFLIFFVGNISIIKNTFCATDVEILVFNGILSYPSVLNNERNSTTLDESYITPTEFLKILKSLYISNYIAVKLSDVVQPQRLQLPAGKKPVVLAIHNVTYGQVGEVNKLIIERNNKIASYTSKRSINKRINYDKEFVTILEDFISSHPDFSYKGAKGTIIITGNKGIFGYKTQKSNANSKFQIKKCAEVLEYLTNEGWEFCATSYIGEGCNSTNLEFASSLNKWLTNVKPLLPATPFYYLHDNINNQSEFDYKSELLYNSDFKYILNSDMSKGEFSSPLFPKGRIFSTKKICGDTLRNNRIDFLDMFDSEILYDRLNRSVPF